MATESLGTRLMVIVSFSRRLSEPIDTLYDA